MIKTQHVELDHVTLHYAEAGPTDGAPVLLLHGYPDLWFTWEEQLQRLARRGYRVLAPDQRGYGRSSKPPHVKAYRLQTLGDDMASLLRRLNATPAHVVGHDWGGVVAYRLAAAYPELVRSLTIVNAPHPEAYRKVLFSSLEQLWRSWYIFMFQIPGLAEWINEVDDSALLLRLLASTAPRSQAELERYRIELRNPSAARTPLYWYRAAVRYDLFQTKRAPVPLIETPTQILWGKRDPALTFRICEESARFYRQVEVHTFDASHWPFLELPDAFDARLSAFLERHITTRPNALKSISQAQSNKLEETLP
jgi:pimeloyl-ACP methyl ester carboxylesterase